MPIEYRIDMEKRIVFAKTTGTMTDKDVFDYQRDVWSRPEVAGFDELMDMSEVEKIVVPSSNRVMELADLSATMDKSTGGSRFAIYAPGELSFGLGRMFQTFREMNPGSTKQVGVFRTMAQALDWLGVKDS